MEGCCPLTLTLSLSLTFLECAKQRYGGAVVETSCIKEVGRLWKGKRERDLVFIYFLITKK